MSNTDVSEELVEIAARAIFFDQHSIMHDHEKLWQKSNQVVWRSGARAVIEAIAPRLRAQGLREAAELCLCKDFGYTTLNHLAHEDILARADALDPPKETK